MTKIQKGQEVKPKCLNLSFSLLDHSKVDKDQSKHTYCKELLLSFVNIYLMVDVVYVTLDTMIIAFIVNEWKAEILSGLQTKLVI